MERRGLLLGLSAALAAPAIVKAENLMKVAVIRNFINPPTIYDPVILSMIERYYVNWIANDIIGVPSMSEFTSENFKKSLAIKYRYENKYD